MVATLPFPGTDSYNAAIKACGDAGEWKRAVALLEKMRRGHSTTKPCAEGTSGDQGELLGGRCDAALQVGVAGADGEVIRRSEVNWSPWKTRPSPDATSSSMAVTAPLLLAILIDRMRSSTVSSSAPCYTSALEACADAGLCERGRSLVDDIAAAKVGVEGGPLKAVA